MEIPDMDSGSGFILKENSNDSGMVDICTVNPRGRTICWGSIMNDAIIEAGFSSAEIMAWEGIPENKKRLKSITVTLCLYDYEVD